MDVTNFEIVDLGPAPEGAYDLWGASYRENMTCSVVGEADNAASAFQDAMNQIAMDGLGTGLVNESGMEMGLYSATASTPATAIESHLDPDEDDEDADLPVRYYVGIRYEGPEDEIIEAETV